MDRYREDVTVPFYDILPYSSSAEYDACDAFLPSVQ